MKIYLKLINKLINNKEIREYDSNNNEIHYKNPNGFEYWKEYDSDNNEIHYKDSNGFETWYNSNGKEITKAEFDKLFGLKMYIE